MEATKLSGAQKPGDAKEDKSPWQLRTEAAYDLLTEVRRLQRQLDLLRTAISTLNKDRGELTALVSLLGTISEPAYGKSESEHKLAAANLAPVETSDSDLLTAEAAKALNRIFSKRPTEKPPAEAAKKDATKKDDAAKKDTAKKDDTAGKE